MINDQYFTNNELAALLHKRLTDKVNPLDFAIILLTRELGESEYIDPVLYKARSKAMNIVLYGHQENNDFGNLQLNSASSGGSELTKPICGKYNPNEASYENKGITHKVVFLSPINKGTSKNQNVNVHAKHMIVEDVWMTVGSANLGARSMTYDWEMNANIVDLKLHKGGTTLVRNQRIEILARIVGIPPSYSAVFQELYASFQLLKAIERNGNKNIYPTRAAVKKLPIDFSPFEPGPFVANLNIILDFEEVSEPAIRQLITDTPDLHLRVTATVTTYDDPNKHIISEALVIDRYALVLVQEDDPEIVDNDDGELNREPLPPVIRLRSTPNNNFFLVVSALNSIMVTAQLVDGDVLLGYSGTIDMQPNGRVGIDFGDIDIEEEVNEYPPAFTGETINRTIVVSQETP